MYDDAPASRIEEGDALAHEGDGDEPIVGRPFKHRDRAVEAVLHLLLRKKWT